MGEKIVAATQLETELVNSFAFSRGDVDLQGLYLLWLSQAKKIIITWPALYSASKSEYVLHIFRRVHSDGTGSNRDVNVYYETATAMEKMKKLESKGVDVSSRTEVELRVIHIELKEQDKLRRKHQE